MCELQHLQKVLQGSGGRGALGWQTPSCILDKCVHGVLSSSWCSVGKSTCLPRVWVMFVHLKRGLFLGKALLGLLPAVIAACWRIAEGFCALWQATQSLSSDCCQMPAPGTKPGCSLVLVLKWESSFATWNVAFVIGGAWGDGSEAFALDEQWAEQNSVLLNGSDSPTLVGAVAAMRGTRFHSCCLGPGSTVRLKPSNAWGSDGRPEHRAESSFSPPCLYFSWCFDAVMFSNSFCQGKF